MLSFDGKAEENTETSCDHKAKNAMDESKFSKTEGEMLDFSILRCMYFLV